MATKVIAGGQLEWMEAGSGDPLLLVHGSASDHRTWRIQLEALAPRFRVMAYSRRFHWPNAPIAPHEDYVMGQHVADLAAVLDSLPDTPVHLVGHSYGAFVCLLLALQRPRGIRSLVLAEPPVVTLFGPVPPRPPALLRLLATRPRTAWEILKFGALGVGPATAALRRGDPEGAQRAFGTAVLGRKAYRRLSAERLQQVRTNFIHAELLGSGLPPVDPEALRGLRVPTLLVHGQRSPRLFHRLADRLAALLPDVLRAEIPDASHIVHEDQPEAFNRAVLEFLDRLERRDGASPDNGAASTHW